MSMWDGSSDPLLDAVQQHEMDDESPSGSKLFGSGYANVTTVQAVERQQSNLARSSSLSQSFAKTLHKEDDRLSTFVLRGIFLALLFPLIGTFYACVGVARRRDPTFFPMEGEWVVVVALGVLTQIALFCPLMLIFYEPAWDSLNKLPTHGLDLYGPLVVYPALCIYFITLAMVYFFLLRRESARAQQRRTEIEGAYIRSKKKRLNPVLEIREHLKEMSALRSELVLPGAALLALLQVAFVRSCFLVNNKTGQYCTSAELTVFSSPEYRNNAYVWIVTAFWFVIVFIVDAVILLGCVAYAKQLKQVEYFTSGRTNLSEWMRKSPRGGDDDKARSLPDLYDPQNVSVWTQVWEVLWKDVKHNPVTEALRSTTFLANVLIVIASLCYIAIRNALDTSNMVATFTNGAIALSSVSLLGIILFVMTTVKLQRAVSHHEMKISMLASEGNWRLSMANRNDGLGSEGAQLVRYKTFVLETLDLYTRASPTNPKLLGMSLETLRFVGIVVGLAMLNGFFVILFLTRCY